VKFADGAEHAAKVVGKDPASDLALLKIEVSRTLPFLRLGDSDALRVGDWVIAVGNPLGLGHTVTSGIVSGKGRNIPEMPLDEFLQTDASINPGNSGGPLVALDGSVIGVNTAIIQGANSVGFAIPSTHVRDVVEQLKQTGTVARGYIGVQMAELPRAAREALGDGVLLADVVPDGPAATAGLLRGDVILRVAGKEVKDTDDLQRAIAAGKPGSKVEVVAMRRGQQKTVSITLGERPSAE
jgi:serine protease Do